MQASIWRLSIAAVAICLVGPLARAQHPAPEPEPTSKSTSPATSASLRYGDEANPPAYLLLDYDAPPYRAQPNSDSKVVKATRTDASRKLATADTSKSKSDADDSDPSWITRQRALATSQAATPSSSPPRSPTAQDDSDDDEATNEQPSSPPAALTSDPAAKKISTKSAAMQELAQIHAKSTSATTNTTTPTSRDIQPSSPASPNSTSAQAGGCESCNSSTCGWWASDSCGTGSCGSCDSCNTGQSCDWFWKHKCRPLVQIDDCCPLKCETDEVHRCFGDCCWLKCRDITVTGWLDGGIMGNGRDTADHFNGPLTFPDRNGEGQFNQAWLAIDRTAPADNCEWFIGGHVDYFFGSDYFFTTAAGLDGTRAGNTPRWNTTNSFSYGFSMPQLYFETDYGTDWKMKWGHFFTIIGYEVPPAIGNFFYSHSYTMQYGEPFTHTGYLATYTRDNWSFSGGITAGWNTFDAEDAAGFLGGITYTDKDWGSLALAITTGDDSEVNLPGVEPLANRTMYSLVWSRNFTSRFTYVLQHDWGCQNDAQTARGGGAQWYGINQYLFYKLNCCWTAGLRIEWFRDDDGFVVTGLRPGNAIVGASFPGNFYECTLGLNYKPNGNLAIRPEIRWDWYDGLANQNPAVPVTFPYAAGSRTNQFTFGVDLIYQW